MPEQLTDQQDLRAPGAWRTVGDETPGRSASASTGEASDQPTGDPTGEATTTTAWDRAGLACVTLDGLGTPAAVHVADDWARRAGLDTLAAAVLEAARTAARTLDERAWAALAQEARRRSGDDTPLPATGARVAVTAPVPQVGAEPRPLDELAEIAISSLSAATSPSAADDAVVVGTGWAWDRQVEVHVARGGIVGVALRGPHVAAAGGPELSHALTEATRAASVDLARRLAQQSPALTAELLEEVLTHLRNLPADPFSVTGRG
mgnify:CR=1 FL=1